MTESNDVDHRLSEYLVDSVFTSLFAVVAIGIYTLPVTIVVYSLFSSTSNMEYLVGLSVVTWGIYVAQLTIRNNKTENRYESDLRRRMNRWANIVYHNVMVGFATVGGAFLVANATVPDVGVLFAVLAPAVHHELFVPWGTHNSLFIRRSLVRSPIVIGVSSFFGWLTNVLEEVPDVQITEPELGAVPNLDDWVQRYQSRRAG